MKIEGRRIDGIGGRAVESDRRDPTVDQRARCDRIRVTPAGPIGIRTPVPRVVRVEEDDVAGAATETRVSAETVLAASRAVETAAGDLRTEVEGFLQQVAG